MMEPQIQSLYNAIHTYKNSLLKILDKTEEILLDVISKYNDSAKLSCQKKRELAKQMVEMLQNYVQMFNLCESTYEELALKMKENADDQKLVEISNNSNPFFRNTTNNATHVTIEMEDKMRNSQEMTNHKSDLMRKFFIEEIQTSDSIEEQSTVESNQHLDDKLFIDFNIDLTAKIKKEPSIIEKLDDEFITNTINENTDNCVSVEEKQNEDLLKLGSSTTPPPVTNKKQNNRVTFKLNNQENLKNVSSAVTKLKAMPHFDRREETLKTLLGNNIIETLEWTKIKHLKENNKKIKEKNPIFDIPEDNLSVNDFCNVCYVESPSEFYVRINQELFEKVEMTLNEEMNNQRFVVNNFKSKEEAQSYIGKFAVAFFQNKRKWHRIEILNWIDSEPENIYVQLIDYGNKMYWNYKNVKNLTDFFAKFPKMAIRCHLASIYSSDLQNRNIWPKQSCQFFTNLVKQKPVIKFMVIFAYKENNSYGIDLLINNDENEKSVGEILVESGHACQIQIEVDNSELDDFEEMNINEVITGYDAQDEARICPFSNKFGHCFKGPSCKLEHGQLAEDGLTTDKIPTMNQPIVTMTLPTAGETVNILITGYVTTCHFYAHILTNQSNSNLYNDNFLQLKDTMKANNLVHTYEKFTILPGLAEFVLVQEGCEWLRGVCVEYADNEEIEIFLVDFGYTILKTLKDLRKMKEDFLHVPFQAVECILDSCQEKPEITKEISRKFYDTCMHMHIFQASVVESTEPLRVQLWDSNNIEMRYVLKQYGIGEDQKDNFYPAQNYILSCH